MPVFLYQNKNLYLILLLTLGLMVLFSFWPGFMKSGSAWVYRFFDPVCHQLPDRSYHINGNQLAVCSRCLGIYTSLLTGWLLMPVFIISGLKKGQWFKNLFLIVLFINLIDILGNYFELWTNTLTSRLLLGAVFGISVTLMLSTDFFKKKKG